MFDNEIDYGKLAFMRLGDVEAGLRTATARPRFSGVKVSVFPFADITNRSAEAGVFGAEGSVSILSNIVVRLDEPVSGELELRVNDMPAIVTGLDGRQAGRADIVMTGAVTVGGRDNVITIVSSGTVTLISAEIMLFGEGVTCQSGAGINYACMDKCAVALNIRDNRIYAQVFGNRLKRGVMRTACGNSASVAYEKYAPFGQNTASCPPDTPFEPVSATLSDNLWRQTGTVRISRGISADVIADEGIFKVFFVDDERNLWYCEMIGGEVRNIRWLAAGIIKIAVSQTEGDPLAIVTGEDGVVRFGYVRERLGRLRDFEGVRGVRGIACVKGTRTPRVVVTGFNGRSVVRTGDTGEEVGMGVVRGSAGYVIR